MTHVRHDYFTLLKNSAVCQRMATHLPEEDSQYALSVFSGRKQSQPSGVPCTHPVQTYIDLKQAGGRGDEAAEALLEQKIKPIWKKANLTW